MSQNIHPEIKQGLDAVQLPEVQEMIKRLGEHGLAVALPHSHNEDGAFLPLGEDEVSFESDQKVSFIRRDDPVLEAAIPVMWRWNDGAKAVASCALCDLYKHP